MTPEEKRLRNRQYQRTYEERHKERLKVLRKAQRQKHKVRRYQSTAEWKKRHPEKVAIYDRRKYLKRRNRIRAERLGVTVEEVELWLRIGRCEACGETLEDGGGHIDHCHATGKLRGLLCKACNYALGIAKECPGRLEALARYARERCQSSRKSRS